MKKTPLHPEHVALGARLVEFGGWEMPVQYSGIKEEHLACRNAAGLFDVSHMGEIVVRGRDALALIQKLTPNDAARLRPGMAQYSALTTPQGTFVDDILIYCRAADDYLVVVNASNTVKDLAWIVEHQEGDCTVEDQTEAICQIALQGPMAQAILQPLVAGHDLDRLGYYRFETGTVAGHRDCLVARTGYTGEDGFEIYLPSEHGRALWQALLAAGEKSGVKPCGLGARDTLRLEAKLPLYGNDIDDTTTVIEAGLGWIVKPDKGDFIGKEVLGRQKAEGAGRSLVGFAMVERGVPRHGHPAFVGDTACGNVTSGGFSPTLEKNIGLVYVPTSAAAPGTKLAVEIRDKRTLAEVVPTPFVPHRTRLGHNARPNP